MIWYVWEWKEGLWRIRETWATKFCTYHTVLMKSWRNSCDVAWMNNLPVILILCYKYIYTFLWHLWCLMRVQYPWKPKACKNGKNVVLEPYAVQSSPVKKSWMLTSTYLFYLFISIIFFFFVIVECYLKARHISCKTFLVFEVHTVLSNLT